MVAGLTTMGSGRDSHFFGGCPLFGLVGRRDRDSQILGICSRNGGWAHPAKSGGWGQPVFARAREITAKLVLVANFTCSLPWTDKKPLSHEKTGGGDGSSGDARRSWTLDSGRSTPAGNGGGCTGIYPPSILVGGGGSISISAWGRTARRASRAERRRTYWSSRTSCPLLPLPLLSPTPQSLTSLFVANGHECAGRWPVVHVLQRLVLHAPS